jgi:beta-mannosidase
VYQAEAMRTAVEHWRRHPERTSGALYWQLNDCWPGISWSSIDYSGRWKALHHAARRFYAPVLLSIEESREGGKRKAALWLSNDSCSPWQGHLRWTLETLDGTVLQGGDQPVRCAALSAACVLRQDFSSHRGRIDWRKTVLTAELWQDDRRLATQVVAFVPEKMMRLGRPGLQARIVRLEDGGLGVQVSTRRLARFVELSFGSQEPLEIGSNFSDNYFDLPAGRSVIIPCTLPADWTVEQAQAALRTRSLGDIRPIDPLWISNLRTGWALTRSASEILFRQLILPVLKK